MKKLTKDYFGESVILLGYSSEEKSFSRMVHKEMIRRGMKVYPVNNNAGGNYDIQVYASLGDLPEIPDTACVLVGKSRVLEAVRELASFGVKRVLVQSKNFIDQDVEDFCTDKGMALAVGCPFMAIGKGLHRFHGFLAGVK